MGQKTHPTGFRLGIVKPWKSRWFAIKDMPALLKEDELIRKYLMTRLGHAAIAEIHIERKPGKATVTIHTGRPGVVIGKRGAEVDKLRDELSQLTGKDCAVNVEEIKRPEISAALVAQNIAHQIEQRVSFRRCCLDAGQPKPREDIVVDGHRRERVGALEHHAYLFASIRHGEASRVDVLPVEHHLTRQAGGRHQLVHPVEDA